MPPKQKFAKKDVLKAAFQLVREQGIENLNARNIAKMLNSSTQPVFSHYKNMDDLKADLFTMVSEHNNSYFFKINLSDASLTGKNLLVNIGMAYIDFALDEPNLFRLMFLSRNFTGKTLSDFFSFFDHYEYEEPYTPLEKAINELYDIDSPETMRMFIDIWLYAHGIASMLALNQLPTPRSEIEAMLKNMYDMIAEKNKKIRKKINHGGTRRKKG